MEKPRRSGRHPTFALPAAIAIIEPTLGPISWKALDGLSPNIALLLRGYDVENRHALAQRLAATAQSKGALFMIAGDMELARQVGADAVHLPERMVRLYGRTARRHFRFVTCAAHSPAALRLAQIMGLDAALLSPVFATQSHPGAQPLGLYRASAMVRMMRLQCYALGGVDRASARRLPMPPWAGHAGIRGFATLRTGSRN